MQLWESRIRPPVGSDHYEDLTIAAKPRKQAPLADRKAQENVRNADHLLGELIGVQLGFRVSGAFKNALEWGAEVVPVATRFANHATPQRARKCEDSAERVAAAAVSPTRQP